MCYPSTKLAMAPESRLLTPGRVEMNYLDVRERRSFHEGITDALGDILVGNDPGSPRLLLP